MKKTIIFIAVLSLIWASVITGYAYGSKTALPGTDSYISYISQNDIPQVVVAVIDSGAAGIDTLGGRLTEGYDFVDGDTDTTNDISSDSHGTFVAGIIADITADLPVSIMPVRVLEDKNVSVENLVSGIYYAVDNGADIINLSIGGEITDCSEIDEAIAYADENNVVVVVSAGNAKKEITAKYCPAHNESCITVSAVDEYGKLANCFSNYGDVVDCCAPGVNITGYDAKGETVTRNGTSFSAPIISAACALLKLANPDFTDEQIQETLKSICNDLGDEGKDKYYGCGLPDFNRLLPASVGIVNYTDSLKVGYYSTVTLHAETDIPFSSQIKWFVNGEHYSSGETFTITEADESFEVYFTVDDGRGYIIKSETETVTVKTDFFSKILAFFRLIFNNLPEWVDNVKQ